MKDKNKILAECVNQKCFPDIDSPLDNLENVPQHQIKKAMDEYAEEYAKDTLLKFCDWWNDTSATGMTEDHIKYFLESLKK